MHGTGNTYNDQYVWQVSLSPPKQGRCGGSGGSREGGSVCVWAFRCVSLVNRTGNCQNVGESFRRNCRLRRRSSIVLEEDREGRQRMCGGLNEGMLYGLRMGREINCR